MNTKIAAVIGFVVGAASGAVGAWRLLDSRYSKMAQEEIDMAKKVYREILEEERQEFADYKAKATDPCPEKDMEEPSHQDYDEIAYFEEDEDGEDEIDQMIAQDRLALKDRLERLATQDGPYVISSNELGELPDYSVVPLTYYADKILADYQDIIVEDQDRIIGKDSLEHIGEEEPYAVFVRNDALRCDYEITCDTRTYVEAVSKHKEE